MTRVLRRGHLCSFYLSALPACSYERYCARSARSYETYECCIPIAAVAVVAGRRRPAQGFRGLEAAAANAIYNAKGVRVRDHPITLDKLLDRLPGVG